MKSIVKWPTMGISDKSVDAERVVFFVLQKARRLTSAEATVFF